MIALLSDCQSVVCHGRFLGLLAVEGLDDLAYEGVADDVLIGEDDGADSLDVLQEAYAFQKAGILAAGEIDLGRAPVTMNLAFMPILVRNILSWDRFVFWASSRMTHARSSVRPRM